jgi:hypothetical protein
MHSKNSKDPVPENPALVFPWKGLGYKGAAEDRKQTAVLHLNT